VPDAHAAEPGLVVEPSRSLIVFLRPYPRIGQASIHYSLFAISSVVPVLEVDIPSCHHEDLDLPEKPI
jgi:hypothetical protein